MKIELCEEFFYCINDATIDLFKLLNTSKENVIRNNNKIKIYVGEWIKVKTNKFKIHYVKPVENIYEIAKSYNTTAEKIIEDNKLNSSKLFIGQVIKIF